MEDMEKRFREIISSRSDPGTFYGLLGMRLEELEEGRALFTLPVEERFFNAGGVVHGGVFASMADAAVAAALATMVDPEGESIATVEMKINYMAPARGGSLVAEGRIIQRGRTVAVGECAVRDDNGRMLAKAMATFLVRARADVG